MKKKDPLRMQSYGILAALLVQYLLGMAANLFVAFPDTANKRALWEFARSQSLVMLHILVAFLLVIGSLIMLIQAIRRKEKHWIIAGSVGLVAIVIAFIGGLQFIPTQQDGYSYAMAVAFIIAVFSYGWGIYKAK